MISGAQKAATHDWGSCCRHLSVLDAMKWVFLRLTSELQKFSRISEELLSTVTVSGSEEGLPRSSQGVRMNPASAGVCLQPALDIMASPLPKSEMMHIFSWWQDQGTRQGRAFSTLEMHK